MTDDPAWMASLRCPSCGDAPEVAVVATPPAGRGLWGTLTCRCSTYPIIDDIPIVLPDRVATSTLGVSEVLEEGPAVDELVELVRGPDPIRALVRLLSTPPVPWPFARVPQVVKAASTAPVATVLRRLGDGRVRRLLRDREDLTTEELLATFYLQSLEVGHAYAYFLMRTSQPRHLAMLSLLETVPEGPVLDVGCGIGHHCWQLGLRGRDAIGVDRNFAQLWIGRWWVATGSHFVCADANRPLPFADDAVTTAWFGDSVEYVDDPQSTIAEMRRCARTTVYLSTVCLPARGWVYSRARPLDEWRRMVSSLGPHHVIADHVLVQGYLDGRAADLSADSSDADLGTATTITVVASDDPSVLDDHGALQDPPPHARGRLVVNPIYAPVGDDLRHLRLAMPADWFAFEDGALTRYHDHQAWLTDEQVVDLRRNELTPALRQLVDRFVVIGVPHRYVKRQRRRFKLRAYQVITALRPSSVDVPEIPAPPGQRPIRG
jgi:SAM-dependent methyltransferase/uncharacterized protein YbaR (Trm112 family)